MKLKMVGRGLTSKHIVEATFPTGVSNGGRIFVPGSTHLAPNSLVRCRSLALGLGDDSLALLQHRAILDIHIKEVDFLISLSNLAALVYPQDCVLDPVCIKTRLVDADVDWQLLAAGFFLQTEDKVALVDWLDEFDRLFP